MKLKFLILWIVILIAIALFSIPLAGIVEDGLVQPIVKFFWVLRGYYGSIHQSVSWVVVLIGVAVIAILSLRIGVLNFHVHRRSVEKLPGEVGQLAFWMNRFERGTYPRWYLARTLADLAHQILQERGSDAERGGDLEGPGWKPPGDIQLYLETALHTTPVTFKRQLERNGITTEPDMGSIINYLESYMESSNGH